MRTEVIAEIGINHQNDIGIARDLISLARAGGAAAAKFQCSTVTEEVSFRHAPEHFQELGRLVPTTSFLRQCANICDDEGIEFLCTPAGPDSLKIVLDLGVRRIKVASDNLTNHQFLRQVAKANLPVILSTGMATLLEVHIAARLFLGMELTVMHCVSAYPCPAEEANLRAITTLRKEVSGQIGYSDHTTSIVIPAAAVALGAQVIEKHITLDHKMAGPDHAASLDPLDFGAMMENIREVEAALGDGHKAPRLIEAEGMRLYRKSLVAIRPIAKGEEYTADNVTAKRPGTGMPAETMSWMVGFAAGRDFAEDEQIE